MTFAIYIFVAPFILYEMGTFSFVTLPANILIMPFFPITIILGFLTGFIGLLSNFLAVPFAYVSYYLLHYQLWVINFFAGFPFATCHYLALRHYPAFFQEIKKGEKDIQDRPAPPSF